MAVTKQQFIKLYEKLFRLVSGMTTVNISLNEREKKMVDKFLLKYDVYSEDWLFDYLIFQFSRYHDKQTMYGKGVVQVNWVIGGKADEAWRNRTEQHLYYADKFKQQYGITKETNFNTVLSEDWTNRERKRFFNTERGFLNCQELEIKKGANKWCLICKFKKYCE